MRTNLVVMGLALAATAAMSCNNKKNDNNNNNNNNNPPGGVSSVGGPGNVSGNGATGSAALPTVNMAGARSLLVVDPSAGAAGLVDAHNNNVAKLGLDDSYLLDGNSITLSLDGAVATDGSKSLEKTDGSGNVTSAMTAPKDQQQTTAAPSGNNGGNQPPPPPQQPLPKIQTIALSPTGEVYLEFAQPFQIKANAAGGDPMANGDSCQIFQVEGGTLAQLQAAPPTSSGNLLCLDSDHMINSWSGNLSVFQFDSAGNVYYPGQVPNGPTMVVYKWDRKTHALTEMINSNICVQDFLVTPSGGLFYTGQSACGGGGNGNGGFFRYIDNTGALTEIARGWSNFIYQPVSTATSDQAVFFGPDPRSASVASWQDACLFDFNPAGGSTTAARTTPKVSCGQSNDIQNWLNMNRDADIAQYGYGFNNNNGQQNDPSSSWLTEAAKRCTSDSQIFAGGGNQISSIAQDSKGNLFVIGDVGKKIAGTVECGINVRGPHCAIAGMPDLTKTVSTCASAGGAWKDDGNCSNGTSLTSDECFAASGSQSWNRNQDFYQNVTGSLCTSGGAMSAANWNSNNNAVSLNSVQSQNANTAVYRIQNFNCQNPSSDGNWTAVYQGLGKVNTTTQTLSLLSGTSEQALNLWVINDVVYYSAFDVSSGEYSLETINSDGTTSTMASNLEVYHLNDAGDGTNLYFDGLDFTDNSYSFGTILSASPYTRASKTGLTGTLKTVVILPKI